MKDLNHDADLMARVARGEEKAFQELYESHKHRVYGLCVRIMGFGGGADDMAQEAWIKIVKNASMYRPVAKVSAWISQVTRNTCLNGLRGVKFEVELSETDDILSDPGADLENVFLSLEQAKVLEKAFAELPAQQRAVLTMFIYEDLSHAEIAVELSVSIGAVKQLIFRAKENLKIHVGRPA